MRRQQISLRERQHHIWLLLIVSVCLAACRAAESPSANAANTSRIHVYEDGICREAIRTNVVGDFYFPTTTRRVPGLILLGGSDGEPMKDRSALLASNGYAVLNLFYFGHDSLSKNFAAVPIEYLTNAVSWLLRQEQVDPARIAVIG